MNIHNHPCFNQDIRHQFGRIHLPVAPKCNIQCNYCNRKYNCANENRPGVTSATLNPEQALQYLEAVLKVDPRITVVGIAGPGDPFANPVETLKTLRLVRKRFPEMLLCVSSNGLNIIPYIREVVDLKVSHVTITVNAVDSAIGARIYGWVRDHKLIYRNQKGAEVLLERQLGAIASLKQAGIVVKINSILIPGINDQHIEAIAEKMAGLGVDLFNCIPLLPTTDTAFADIQEPSAETMVKIRSQVKRYLPQMEHCTRCRADAVGLLGQAPNAEMQHLLYEKSRITSTPSENRSYIAVASREGILINQHLGEATRLLIFAKNEQGTELVETRQTPEPGTGKQRWLKLAEILKDCRCLLVGGIGGSPREILENDGIEIFETEGIITEALHQVFAGQKPQPICRKIGCSGGGCSGGSVGCG